jgi:hypothetical protein
MWVRKGTKIDNRRAACRTASAVGCKYEYTFTWCKKEIPVIKSMIKLVAVFFLLMTTLSPQNASASADVWKLKNESVRAEFTSVDETQCIYTDVIVWASKEMYQEAPGSGTWTPYVLVNFNQSDICKKTTINAFGSAPITQSQLQVAGKLSSATLTATVSMTNWWTGEKYADFDLDLTWTATGPLSSDNRHDQFRYGDYHLNEQFISEFRFAQAVGTVWDGTTNLTPNPAVEETDIFYAKQGSVSHGDQ